MHDDNFVVSSDQREMKAVSLSREDIQRMTVNSKSFFERDDLEIHSIALEPSETRHVTTDGKTLIWHPTLGNAIHMLALGNGRGYLIKPATQYFQELIQAEKLQLEDIVHMRQHVKARGLTPKHTPVEAICEIFRWELANHTQVVQSGRREGKTAMNRIRLKAQLRLLAAHGFMRRSYLRGKYIRNHKGKARKVW